MRNESHIPSVKPECIPSSTLDPSCKAWQPIGGVRAADMRGVRGTGSL